MKFQQIFVASLPQAKELAGEIPAFIYFMEITTIGSFARSRDNDLLYFNLLEAYLDSIDSHCTLSINKTDTKITFRLTPSHPQLLLPLLTAVKELHTKFNITVDFAKSIKTSNNISFSISLGA